MRKASVLTVLIVAVLIVPVSATIINIPGDYPTIQQGINASSDGDTVLVQPGTYVENINFNGHNIVLGSLFLTTGDTSYISSTIIDGDSSGSVVTFGSGEDSTAVIMGFTIQNGYASLGGGISCHSNSSPTISNNIIRENFGELFGGGILCMYCSPSISNNIISENSASNGGGIYCSGNSNSLTITSNTISENSASYGGGIRCWNSSPIITNNTISENSVTWDGGGISCNFGSSPDISYNTISENSAHCTGGGIYCFYSSSPAIINNTISENKADSSGGGFHCIYICNPMIINTIFWADSAGTGNEIYIESGTPTFTYCDIQGGWPGEGNIDIDPLFRDPENSDFHLMATYCGDPYDSPCIDAGHPDILDSLLDCGWGLGEARSDIGAYGGGEGWVGIEEPISNIPKDFMISQNYPNPFNASTTIKYELPKQAHVTIDIYDILGRKVETLLSDIQPAGYHQTIWNADGFSSGVYFYKLQAGDYTETKKMVLLK